MWLIKYFPDKCQSGRAILDPKYALCVEQNEFNNVNDIESRNKEIELETNIPANFQSLPFFLFSESLHQYE